MARPAKLTPNQIAEMQRRHLAGERVTDLAKQFKVSKALVSTLVSKRLETQKTMAKQLVAFEEKFEQLPVYEQNNIRSIADQLKGISANLANAAYTGSLAAQRVNELVYKHSLLVEGDVERLNETATGVAQINEDALKNMMKLSQVANEASKIPLNLLAANKEATKGFAEPPPKNEFTAIPIDPIDASKAYQDMVKG